MAQTTIAVTKRCAYRDSVQEFSNVYTYTDGTFAASPSYDEAKAIVDRLVVLEKPWHSPDVTFIRARVWQSGGTDLMNEMIGVYALTGSGTGPSATTWDRERAYLFSWPAGKDRKGRRVYLRKWYHSQGPMGNVTVTTAVQNQTSGFADSQRTELANLVKPLNPLVVGGKSYDMCAPSGRGVTENVPVAHKYLEHRQLGEQWRG